MRVNRLATVVQYVSDPVRAKEWYAGLLGFEPAPHEVPYFECGGGAGLLLAPSAPGTGRGGTGVFFDVDSVDSTYREKKAAGFTFNEEPYDIGPGRLVTLNDPDGNIVGLSDNSRGGMPGRG